MRLQIAVIAAATLLSGTLASAQLSGGVGNSSGSHSSSSSGRLGGPANPSVPPSLGVSPGAQAPVGHLQPRRDAASDNGLYNESAEEKALDRKIRSICRGC